MSRSLWTLRSRKLLKSFEFEGHLPYKDCTLLSLVSSIFQFSKYFLPKITSVDYNLLNKTVLDLSTLSAQSCRCPLSCLVAYSLTLKRLWPAPASLSLRASSSFAAPSSGLHRQENHNKILPSCFSQLPERQTNLALNHDNDLLFSPPWFPELMCQKPEALRHTCSKNISAICRTIGIERYAGTCRTASRACTHFQRSVLYAQEMESQEHDQAAQPSYQLFSFIRGLQFPWQTSFVLQRFLRSHVCWSTDSKPSSCIFPPSTEAHPGNI